MSRYAIWNKKDPIFTPVGEVFTAERWIARYPIAAVETVKIVCAGGEINGAFFGTLAQMKENYANRGCDFSNCVTDQDILDAIEAYEDAANAAPVAPSTDERIAAALEAQVMMSMPDAEE
jgi:hypothetical protein